MFDFVFEVVNNMAAGSSLYVKMFVDNLAALGTISTLGLFALLAQVVETGVDVVDGE